MARSPHVVRHNIPARTHLPSRATRPRPFGPWFASTTHSGAPIAHHAFTTTPRRAAPPPGDAPTLSPLPHLTPAGDAHIISVTAKPSTPRLATATGYASFSLPGTAALVAAAQLRKGDALAAARFAGLSAAKSAPALIPLCHPIALTGARVDAALVQPAAGDKGDCGGVRVTATVECVGRTGVEMEALAAVCGALLGVVDVVKSVDRAVAIREVRLLRKEGGRSGVWEAHDVLASVVTE